MLRAILFDLDGLLTDTETLHCKAYQQALAEAGYVLTEEDFFQHWVRDGLAIADLCKIRRIGKSPQELHDRKIGIYRHLVRTELRPMPGALEFLARVHGKKMLALVTASAKEAADVVLDTLGIRGYFDVVLTAQDVVRRKPHPDLFLKAAELLGLPPSDCLVLEDAEKGIVAAHAAGMRSIAVPTTHTRDNDFSLATYVVASLSEIPEEWLDLKKPEATPQSGVATTRSQSSE
ncbi:MAG: HAD family phosphatase [Phycisphaerales bacterium]|nr:HAD family phosphatase [Phycisphaerales bacterium]